MLCRRYSRGVRRLLVLFLIVALPLGCGREPGDERPTVRVFAPASLDRVLAELVPAAERELGIRLIVSPAGSGTLAGQITAGAPADVFISANPQWMDELATRGLLDAETRVDLLKNRLVVIVGVGVDDPPASLEALADYDGRIAMGEPTSVPAGVYAKQALETAGVWPAVEARILPAMDVQAALAYVAGGEAELGIVYATDPPTATADSADPASSAPGVRILLTIPAELHDPIVYPAAVLKEADNPGGARRLLEWLQSDTATAIFRMHGFGPR